MPIGGVHVSVAGLSDRSGDTNDSGQINFVGMQPGTYRALFESPKVKSFEREITVRSGQTNGGRCDAESCAASARAAAPAPAEPAAANVGPVGSPQMASVPDVLGREFIGKMPRRETLLSCSGNTRTMMIQLNDPLPERLYDDAELRTTSSAGRAPRKSAAAKRRSHQQLLSVPAEHGALVRTSRQPSADSARRCLSGEPCEAGEMRF